MIPAEESRLRTLEGTIRRIVREELAAMETGRPGVITEYDPEKRMATVQVKGKTRYEDPVTGEVTNEDIAPLVEVPVHFEGGGPFESVFDIDPALGPVPCWVKFSKTSLEDWLTDGEDEQGSDEPMFSLSGAVAEVGLHHFAAAGLPCPKHCWRIGAKDGPQIIFSLDDQKLSIRCINAIEIASGVSINIKALRLFLNDRYVDPVDTSDL